MVQRFGARDGETDIRPPQVNMKSLTVKSSVKIKARETAAY